MSDKITEKAVKKQPWIRAAIGLAKEIRKIRKAGVEGKLTIVLDDELQDSRLWLQKRDYENQLMQQCILGRMVYESPCKWCEDNKECTRDQHGGKGCKDWFLRFLTEDEEKWCEERAKENAELSDGRHYDNNTDAGISGTVQ